MRRVRLLAAAVGLAIVAGCSPVLGVPDEPPDAEGTLTAASPPDPGTEARDGLVWWLESEDPTWDSAEIAIIQGPLFEPAVEAPTDTIVVDREGTAMDPEDLEHGMQVRIWCETVADTSPPICAPSHVQIMDPLR